MPTYAYRCASCEHSFEQYQSFTDDSLTECPACGKAELRKVFNSIGVTFNGSGFYRTDSRSASSSSEGPTKSDSKSDASSKPAAKSDASGAKSPDGASSSSSGAAKSSPATPAKA